jgi:hypothetical protein
LDDSSLLISAPICNKYNFEASNQIAIANLDGTIRTSVLLDDNSNYAYVGPLGYIFVPGGQTKGWLVFDPQLHPLQTIPVPPGHFPGVIYLSPSRTAVAVSSAPVLAKPGDYHYQMFAGQPLMNKGGADGIFPFPGVTDSGSLEPSISAKADLTYYQPIPGEFWFFDSLNQHQLTRRSSGVDSVLPDAAWLAPHMENTRCSGELSTEQPRRFLAYCYGNTNPAGRALPIFWNRDRFIVYDRSGTILLKEQMSWDSSASLSPKGKLVAVSHGKSIDFHTLP